MQKRLLAFQFFFVVDAYSLHFYHICGFRHKTNEISKLNLLGKKKNEKNYDFFLIVKRYINFKFNY